MRIKHYIESHVDVKTVLAAVIMFIILSFIFVGLENHIFWIEVTKMRMRMGADSSFEIAKDMITSKKMLFFNFFFRILSYGIPAYVVARKASISLPYSPLVFGSFLVFISTSFSLAYNPSIFYDYPLLFLFETTFSLGVSVAAGILGRKKRKHIACQRVSEK